MRIKGNQVAIVQGERDPTSGSVTQQVLFTFFSKAEALSALGRSTKNQSHLFQHLLEGEYPALKFDWENINKGIDSHLHVLPDLPDQRDQRLVSHFKTSLHGFTRHLVQADPLSLAPSAKLLRDHKGQLEFLREIIDEKLSLLDGSQLPNCDDNEFYWRQSLHDWGINGDVEETAAHYHEKGDHRSAIEAFTLLTESFPDYAEGHNYLGLSYLKLGNSNKAIYHFRKTIELGRKLFPKRCRKERYWTDLKTRPYIRGLRNLVLALNHQEAYDEAFRICETLEVECGDGITADCHKALLFLNTGNWSEAEKYALRVMNISPMDSAVAAFAQHEQGQLLKARKNFLFALLNYPLGVPVLVIGHAPEPTNYAEAQDYNAGVYCYESMGGYFKCRSPKSKRFFAELLTHPKVVELLKELKKCAVQHSAPNDIEENHHYLKRCSEMKELKFAENFVKAL
ncbi:MAG: tetratricopeptide repeat protein [Proteobacteria bacterium]|nr:tetratricopeptide repeat protein [Pseudomonadota bacterium]